MKLSDIVDKGVNYPLSNEQQLYIFLSIAPMTGTAQYQ